MSGGGSFQVSPGVFVREIDATNVIPAVSTAIGAFAGSFSSGPVEEPVLIGSEKQLAQVFGEPNAANSLDFLTAASYLQYSNSLWVSRADDAGALNASNLGVGVPDAKNDDDFAAFVNTGPSDSVIAKYPGEAGNGISVKFYANGSTTAVSTADFDYVPDSTQPGSSLKDEIHVEVLKDGVVVEKYAGLSIATDAKNERGSNIYFKDVLNRDSEYVRVLDVNLNITIPSSPPGVTITLNRTLSGIADFYVEEPDVEEDDFTSALNSLTFDLTGGDDGTISADGAVNALQTFADAETIDITLMFTSAMDETGDGWSASEKAISGIVKSRKDCVGFISAPLEIASAQGDLAKLKLLYEDPTEGKFSKADAERNSYLVFDASPVYTYNKYLDRYEWIPGCGHMAGLCANTDLVADPWFSPAGFTRGQVKSIVKLAFNPKKEQRDLLYKGGVNFMTAFPGEGIVLYGDKTAQTKPSAFDRINVRRLFIVLEKAIAKAAKYQLFELNDEFTRATFRNMVNPYLREIQGRRGITDFRVVCDDTNNTGEIIDTNQFVGDIYIKPARSINFITLNFIATRTGVEFSEIVGL